MLLSRIRYIVLSPFTKTTVLATLLTSIAYKVAVSWLLNLEPWSNGELNRTPSFNQQQEEKKLKSKSRNPKRLLFQHQPHHSWRCCRCSSINKLPLNMSFDSDLISFACRQEICKHFFCDTCQYYDANAKKGNRHGFSVRILGMGCCTIC